MISTFKFAVLLTVFISAAVLSLGANAQENTMTAGDLLDVCTRPDADWISFCNGFFQASHDQGAIAGVVCAPAGVSRTALVELYAREAGALIRSEPSIGEQSALAVATAILMDAFPC